MKKLFVISLLLLSLVFTVVACKDDPVEPTETTAGETTGTVEDPTAAPADDTTAKTEDPTEGPEVTTGKSEDPTEPPPAATTEKPEDPTDPPEDPTEPPETEPVDPMAPISIFDANALANLDRPNYIESAVVSDDGKYITITPNASDPHYYPFANVEGGRYIAIKYRSPNAEGTAVQLYIGSMGTGPTDDSSMLRQSTIADGEWHIAIFDTQALIDAGIYDGSTVSYFRFDPLECDYMLDENGETYKVDGAWARYPMPEGAIIDVQYIAFFHSVEAAELYDCRPDYIATPEDLATKAVNTTDVTLNDGYVTLTGTGGDGWISALDAHSVSNLNSYVIALRYRTTAQGKGEFFAGSGGGAVGGSEQFIEYISDGEWHTLYADVSALSDMSGSLNYIRYDYFGDANGTTIDVAYIAVFKTQALAEAYDAIINKVPDDTTNFVTDITANFGEADEKLDLQSTDLANLFAIKYGANETQYAVKNGESPYYGVSSFTSMVTNTNGAYAYTVDVVSTDGPEGFASIFLRGIQNASIEKEYYGQDGHDGDSSSMGGAGIYLNVIQKDGAPTLRVNLKTYNGAYVPNITYIPINSQTITVADNGNCVSIMAGDELVATIKISGTKDYGLDAVAADELAATAVMTLADGSEIVYEDACVAASHISQVGIATRTGSIAFNRVSLMPFSSVAIPSFPEAVEYLSSDKDDYIVGEPIIITALGEGKDWVGIAERGADLSLAWYYVADVSGQAVNFFEIAQDNATSTAFTSLPAGEYTLYLLPDDQSLRDGTPVAQKDITVHEPIEIDYVTDGLVSCYTGAGYSQTVWSDVVSGYDLRINANDQNYITADGLRASGIRHNFDKALVDLVNGNTFTVEILLGEFTSIGESYNTFMNSSNDNFALFRRNSDDLLEFKFAANPGDQRPKIPNGLDLINNSLITITYTVGGNCRVYVDGVLMSEKASPSAMGADDLFIGHNQSNKLFDTTYKSIRFYDRELTAEEVLANAKVDGKA